MLTQTLNRIMSWLQQHTPEFAASFEPGLTREAIQDTIEDSDLQLPDEFYELYQWRNGTTSQSDALFSPSLEFSPLNNALQDSEVVNDDSFMEDERDEYAGHLFFPFMFYEGEYYAAVLSNGDKEHTPIVWMAQHDNQPILYCENLTSMMLTLAECYETGAYYLNSNGELENNLQASARILRKYNPNICAKALSITEELLELKSNLPSILLSRLTKELKILEIYKNPDAVEPLLQALDVWKQSRSTEGVSIRSAIVQTLRAFSDHRLFDVFMDVLRQDEVGGIRLYAAQGLGYLGDFRAIPLLIKSLESADNTVSTGASGALFKLQAMDAVLEALPELNTYGRESAAWLLARFGDQKAIEPLLLLQQDQSHLVRDAARKAISILQRENRR